MVMEIFKSFYKPDDLKNVFGDNFTYNDEYFPATSEFLIARYSKEEDGDGFDVDIYAIMCPATFYRIVAKDSYNSCGEFKKGFEISTGSGMGEWVAKTAELISQGMVDVKS